MATLFKSRTAPELSAIVEGDEGWRSGSRDERMELKRPQKLKTSKTWTYSTTPMRSSPLVKAASVPGEVMEIVLDWLKRLHLDGKGCATCWMRDLCSMALCCRLWRKYARTALYEDIQLVGADSAAHKKRFKQAQGCRMVLLRRTLRAKPDLARVVRFLKVPRPERPVNVSAAKAAVLLGEYEDRVAALVRACPNLEKLEGVTATYDHSFRKIFHALSTRRQLRDMVWVVAGSSPPTAGQEDAFLDLHRGWSALRKLSVYSQGPLAPRTLSTTLACLPSLQHLHLCNLAPAAFNDDNLLSLPALRVLILSHVAGVTSRGLSSFATMPNSIALRRLDLRHTPLTSLPALARLLSNLNLLSFTLVQAFPPVMPEEDSFTLWMMPYLASRSLVRLHWDITATPSDADALLARSIASNGFPSLLSLRTPNDPNGRFQSLCRPVSQIALPTDFFTSASLPASPTSPTCKSPMSTVSLPLQPRLYTDLLTARIAAQARLRSTPRITLTVTDSDGRTAHALPMAGYMGDLKSRIHYHLLPDDGATDSSGGLVDVLDLLSDGGEVLDGSMQGCVGSWNYREGVVADKKEKETWWHTERGRWRPTAIE